MNSTAWIERLPPFFQTELGRRVLTGIVGIPLILLLVTMGGRFGSAVLAVVLSLGMIYEYSRMVLTLPDQLEKRWVLLGVTWLVAFANFVVPREEYVLLLLAMTVVMLYFLLNVRRHPGPAYAVHFRELVFSAFGILYLAFLPLFLVLLQDSANGSRWTVLFLLLVWATDSGAYFAGRRYGRRKLYPEVSPKKTVEGGLGGLGAALLVAIVYKLTVFRAFAWGGVLIIPILVGVFSQVGDLFESFFKRSFDRKDSGSLLPGHGGFLDRFDGVLFGLPVMYACVRLFG